MFGGIFGYLKKNAVAVTNYRSLKPMGGAIGALAAATFRSDAAVQSETFEEAVGRLSLSEADLATRRNQLDIQAKICVVFIVAFLAYAAYLALNIKQAGDLIHVLVMLSSISLPASLFIRNSFRVWQIRHRRLGGLQEFLAQPAEWLKD